jgi:kinetochore protein NNF1
MANDLNAPRSPSPLPTDTGAPTQQTPGPRATALADLYSKALSATLRSCSYENFAECFPTPAARTPRVLRAVWEQINGKIAAKGNAEFENILAERNVVPGLNALETMIADAKGRKEAGRGKETGVA